MPRSNFKSERGSAAIEVLGFGVLLMIPIMWFGISVASAQNDQFAVAAIAEHGLRAWVQSDTADSARFEAAVAQIAQDFHEPKDQVTWMFDCGGFDPCVPANQTVRLEVRVQGAKASAVMRWSK